MKDNKNIPLFTAVAIILFVQLPHIATIIQQVSSFKGFWGTIHAWMISISIEAAIVYFTLKKRTTTMVLALCMSTLFNLSFYFPEVLGITLNKVAIGAMTLFIPFLVKELAAMSNVQKEVGQVQEEQWDSRDDLKNRAFKLVDSGHSLRDIESVVGVPRSTISRWNKERKKLKVA